MIKNIVFDMGEVLIRFNRDRIMENVGVTDPADKKLLKNNVFLTYEWAAMDRGILNEETAAPTVLARLPERLHDAAIKILMLWDRPIIPIEGTYELIEELKANGYGIYLLSNASIHQHDYWERIPASKFFDGKLISADHGVVKPQPEIYRLFYETFSLDPAECVFIDDSHMNIEAAIYTGMHGIVFHDDVPELRSRLIELGVNVRA